MQQGELSSQAQRTHLAVTGRLLLPPCLQHSLQVSLSHLHFIALHGHSTTAKSIQDVCTCQQQKFACYGTGEHGGKWQNTKVFPNYQALLQDADAKPAAAFIGLPPKYHGALEDPSANIEVQCSLDTRIVDVKTYLF